MEQPLASSSLALGRETSGSPAPMTPGAASAPSAAADSSALPLEDERTLSQLRRGHFAAMEELVRRYQDRLFATVLRLVGHPEDAADLVQEAFVRAMQNIARFEGKSSLYTWLFRIAVNLSMSHRRSRSYRDAVSLDAPVEDAGDGLNRQAEGLRRQLAQNSELDPAMVAQIHMEHERIIEALQKLEPDFRAMIVLRDIEDCDYEQMAAILEIPVGTVKSRLFRARAALRQAVMSSGKAAHKPGHDNGRR